MARIDIDLLYKMAETYEETIPPPPPTLPAGLAPKGFKDRQIEVKEEEAPTTARFVFNRDLNHSTIKDLIHRFNHIFSLSRGAVSILSSMNRGMILHPKNGIDAYFDPLADEIVKIYDIIGKKSD